MRAVTALLLSVGLLVAAAGLSRESQSQEADSRPIRVATFSIDASPPIGSPLAYDPCNEVLLPLSCRGVVLLGDNKPIVLCAVDWIGIGNGGYEAWRTALAEAAGTTPERVSVHVLHQHDAPSCDLSAEELLEQHDLGGIRYDDEFCRDVIARAGRAVKASLNDAEPVTHIGTGKAKVEKVASNRRILGPDGKVRAMRFTSCRDPELRAEPPGIIDPYARVLSFWNGEEPVAVLSYFATHPQSYYRTGKANPDFPGIARTIRDKAVPEALHVHFNGAGGNIGAGKYNDGSKENRMILARRLADGLKKAWKATEKQPVTAADLGWWVKPVALPPGEHLQEASLVKTLNNDEAEDGQRVSAARNLVWLRRCKAGDKIDLTCLRLGDARVLHMPGELAVEYQLDAQEMRPDQFVAMGAYTDYGPGYICKAIHYEQGGYEASNRASRVAPEVEDVLMPAMRELLAK